MRAAFFVQNNIFKNIKNQQPMKKTVQLLTLILFPILGISQVTFEYFESYSAGDFDSQWDPTQWTGWYGSTSNTKIFDGSSQGHSKSLLIESPNFGGTYADVVAYTPIINSGTAKITFLQFVPQNKDTYTNLQHNYTNSSAEWAVEVGISVNSNATVSANDVTTPFTAKHNEWVEYRFELNYEIDSAYFFYDGDLIRTWQLSINTDGDAASVNQINAINFTAPQTHNSSQALIDDLRIEQYAVNTKETNLLENAITIFPNPIQDKLNIRLDLEEATDVIFNITDLNGKSVMNWFEGAITTNQYTKDVSHLASGFYFVQVTANGKVAIKKLVINH
jgi:hypothetical protein